MAFSEKTIDYLRVSNINQPTHFPPGFDFQLSKKIYLRSSLPLEGKVARSAG
jgi:hypothetical protein